MEYVNITPGQTNETKDANETFSYSYSSDTQKELEKITKKYQPVDNKESKMAQLKKLDESVTTPGTIASIILGTIGCLIMGSGMSMCMVAGGAWFVPGIIIGIIGMAVVGIAYPVYSVITKKEKAKKAPMILALAEEISKEC